MAKFGLWKLISSCCSQKEPKEENPPRLTLDNGNPRNQENVLPNGDGEWEDETDKDAPLSSSQSTVTGSIKICDAGKVYAADLVGNVVDQE